jgi:hypothetical protein
MLPAAPLQLDGRTGAEHQVLGSMLLHGRQESVDARHGRLSRVG